MNQASFSLESDCRSAETRNEENIIAVYEPQLTNRFSKEFERIWKLSEAVYS